MTTAKLTECIRLGHIEAAWDLALYYHEAFLQLHNLFASNLIGTKSSRETIRKCINIGDTRILDFSFDCISKGHVWPLQMCLDASDNLVKLINPISIGLYSIYPGWDSLAFSIFLEIDLQKKIKAFYSMAVMEIPIAIMIGDKMLDELIQCIESPNLLEFGGLKGILLEKDSDNYTFLYSKHQIPKVLVLDKTFVNNM